MQSSAILRRVAIVKTDVSKERSASFIRVTRILSPILVTLMMEALSYAETSVPTKATRRNIPEDAILHGNIRILNNCYQIYVEDYKLWSV
jgi:hypothetical protein